MFQSQSGIESNERMPWHRGGQLDVLEALLAHVRWKQRLSNYIEGKGEEKLDSEMVRRNADCALGQWIHGAGGRVYGETPLFRELMTLHAEFHEQAAEVVCAVDRGEREKARGLLLQGRYAKTASRINALLAKISLEFEFD